MRPEDEFDRWINEDALSKRWLPFDSIKPDPKSGNDKGMSDTVDWARSSRWYGRDKWKSAWAEIYILAEEVING